MRHLFKNESHPDQRVFLPTLNKEIRFSNNYYETNDEAEMGKFIFLGYLKKNGEKTVFLSKNNEIILAKKGSKLGSRFQVTDLTEEALTIKSLTTDQQMVIPLVENRSLARRTK